MPGITYRGALVRLKNSTETNIGVVVDVATANRPLQVEHESDENFADRVWAHKNNPKDKVLVWWTSECPDPERLKLMAPVWLFVSDLEHATPNTAYRADLFGFPLFAVDTEGHGCLTLRTPDGEEMASRELPGIESRAAMRECLHALVDAYMDGPPDEGELFDYTSDFDLLQFLYEMLQTDLDENIRYLIDTHMPTLDFGNWVCPTCADTGAPAAWSCGTIRALVAFLYSDHPHFEPGWGLYEEETNPKTECPSDCGGCSCHINPPCSHCTGNHRS